MKKVFGVLAGIAVAMLLVSLTHWAASLSASVLDIDVADPDALASYIRALPLVAKLVLVAGWLLAPLVGAWLSLRIADWRPGGWIVTLVFLLGGLVNQYALPHPLWMQACALVLPLIGGVLAQRLHRKPYPGEPLLG